MTVIILIYYYYRLAGTAAKNISICSPDFLAVNLIYYLPFYLVIFSNLFNFVLADIIH